MSVIPALPRMPEALRFVLVGAANTAVTYALYLVLLRAWVPMAAYATAYACGIVLSYLATSAWVFRVRPSWAGLARFPVVHLVQALVSFAAFHALVDVLSVPPAVAPLIIVAATLPITFLLARRVIVRPSPTPPLDRSLR